MKKSERKKGFPGLRRAGSLAGRGPMPAAPGSFLVGPSFLGVVETTKEIITHVLASCKHEFQQPKRWMKPGLQKPALLIEKILMIPGFDCRVSSCRKRRKQRKLAQNFLHIFRVGSGKLTEVLGMGRNRNFASSKRAPKDRGEFDGTTTLGYP